MGYLKSVRLPGTDDTLKRERLSGEPILLITCPRQIVLVSDAHSVTLKPLALVHR